MEIRLHASPEVRAEAGLPQRRNVSGAAEAGEFTHADALDHALGKEPEARPEAVAKAEQLLAARQYPPPELIGRISRLLGEHWPSDSA